MKDLLEMLSERSSIKKILAVIGIAGFLAGSIASIYNLRTIFFSSIPDYRGSISNANNANNVNANANVAQNIMINPKTIQ